MLLGPRRVGSPQEPGGRGVSGLGPAWHPFRLWRLITVLIVLALASALARSTTTGHPVRFDQDRPWPSTVPGSWPISRWAQWSGVHARFPWLLCVRSSLAVCCVLASFWHSGAGCLGLRTGCSQTRWLQAPSFLKEKAEV